MLFVQAGVRVEARWNDEARLVQSSEGFQAVEGRRRVVTNEEESAADFNIRKLREHFEAFGYNLDHLTNDEIEFAVVRLATRIARFGVSVYKAGSAIVEAMRPFVAGGRS